MMGKWWEHNGKNGGFPKISCTWPTWHLKKSLTWLWKSWLCNAMHISTYTWVISILKYQRITCLSRLPSKNEQIVWCIRFNYWVLRWAALKVLGLQTPNQLLKWYLDDWEERRVKDWSARKTHTRPPCSDGHHFWPWNFSEILLPIVLLVAGNEGMIHNH